MDIWALRRLSEAFCTCLVSSLPEILTSAVSALTEEPSFTQRAVTVPPVEVVMVCSFW